MDCSCVGNGIGDMLREDGKGQTTWGGPMKSLLYDLHLLLWDGKGDTLPAAPGLYVLHSHRET